MTGKVLIAGATGLVGGAALRHFNGLAGWDVAALSRRRPEDLGRAAHLSVDLSDPAACAEAAAGLSDVTHLVYAAVYEKQDVVAGWRDPEHIAVNAAMLRHLFDPLAAEARGLRHVSLMQGAKAYGVHIRPFPVPAKEGWPRHPHDNFYWEQEDYIRARRAGAQWRYTILRPHAVTGFAVGSAINMVAAVGALAALEREQGRPFSFPGGPPFVQQMSDSRLIARAFEWAASAPAAADQTFNIANGDVAVWQNLWPAVARHFAMEVGPDRPRSLGEEMPAMAPLWDRIVRDHGLVPLSLEHLIGASWKFADFVLGYGKRPGPSLLSTIKIRQAGFHDCMDSEVALLEWLTELQDRRILPR